MFYNESRRDIYTTQFWTGEPLQSSELTCVGLMDAQYVGDPLTDSITILALENAATGEPEEFYCGVSTLNIEWRIATQWDFMVSVANQVLLARECFWL